MRVIVASDIHGYVYYAKKLVERFKAEKAEQLILLGDIYYHGSGTSEEYDEEKVKNLLNDMWDKIVCTRGNCDNEVDEMVSRFSFIDSLEFNIGEKKVYLAHGNRINWEFPHYYGDIIIFGHLHKGFIKKEQDVIIANTGSVSLPRGGTENSYIVLTDKTIELKNLDGKVLDCQELN